MPKRTREEDKGTEPRRSQRKRTRTSFGEEFEVDEPIGAGGSGIGGPSISTTTPAADPINPDPEPEPPMGKTVTCASSPTKWKQPLPLNHGKRLCFSRQRLQIYCQRLLVSDYTEKIISSRFTMLFLVSIVSDHWYLVSDYWNLVSDLSSVIVVGIMVSVL